MALQGELDRIAARASSLARDSEELAGVLAAEPTSGGRVYLCAFRASEAVSWLAVDDSGEPLTSRDRVREAASLIALSELAEESAGGGELDELLAQLVALRMTENPDGIEEAEEAVRELQRTLGAPRVATATYLDEVGVAAKRLEAALGSSESSPFVEAMKASAGAVQAFTKDVEENYKTELD